MKAEVPGPPGASVTIGLEHLRVDSSHPCIDQGRTMFSIKCLPSMIGSDGWRDVRSQFRARLRTGMACALLLPNDIPEFSDIPLSDDERNRSAGLRDSADRLDFEASRRAVRYFLGLETCRIPLPCGPHGKPLPLPGIPSFSSSRCRGWCLLSFVERGEIGVDMETLPMQPETAGVAGEVLSTSETAWLEKQRGSGAIAFLKCWTRKEAIMKRAGTGLFGDLREVETEPQLESGEILKNAPTTRIWTFRTSTPNAVCAIAVGHDVEDLSVLVSVVT